MKKVAVIMGSDSDLPVLKGAFEQLKKLGIPFEAHVYSAHRTHDPDQRRTLSALHRSRAGHEKRRQCQKMVIIINTRYPSRIP